MQKSSELSPEVHETISHAPVGHSAETLESLVRASRSQLVADLAHSALLGRDVESLFRQVVVALRETLGVDHAEILLQPGIGEPLVPTASSTWIEEIQAVDSGIASDRRSLAGYTLQTDVPVFVDDVRSETRFFETSRLIEKGVISSVSVAIPGPTNRYGVVAVHSKLQRQFTVDDGGFLESVAKILGSVIENMRAVAQAEQSARYETALAECAQALLASSGDNRIQHALETLFVATEANYVFLERNVLHPELGLSSQTLADAGHSEDEFGAWSDFWDVVSWEQMPTSRKALEAGLPIVIVPDELEGPEYDLYASDPHPIKSELDVPIFVNGEWTGLIGFADQTQMRIWSDSDVSLLTTVAKMIGAFWEREARQESLLELNRAKDSFLASVSHELRTPLTAVVGFAQILKDSADTMSSEERSELLELLVHNGTDLSNMVSDLLVAARADMGALEVVSVPFDLHSQAAHVLESLDREQSSHIKLSGDPVRAKGDPERVRQIVRNLLSNALRYGGDTIRIEVLTDSDKASVLVCDNGTVIPEDDRERIFQPYQRAHDAREVTGSIGLGLSISRQLSQLMNGDLIYRRDDGENVFEFSLASAT